MSQTPNRNLTTRKTIPAYRTRPFGNYYLSATVGTDSAQTAATAGFYPYTQSTNLQAALSGQAEIKDLSGALPIGPRYIAATNNSGTWGPIDTDGDGIPDYVENWRGKFVIQVIFRRRHLGRANKIPFPYSQREQFANLYIPSLNLTLTDVKTGPVYIFGRSGLTISSLSGQDEGCYQPPIF